jgi:hypothetical protein
VQEHLAQKQAVLKHGGVLPPTLDQTRAETVHRLFVAASRAEAVGDEVAADELRRMAVTLRGPVLRPEGSGLVGAPQAGPAEPVSSTDFTLDEVSEFLGF